MALKGNESVVNAAASKKKGSSKATNVIFASNSDGVRDGNDNPAEGDEANGEDKNEYVYSDDESKDEDSEEDDEPYVKVALTPEEYALSKEVTRDMRRANKKAVKEAQKEKYTTKIKKKDKKKAINKTKGNKKK